MNLLKPLVLSLFLVFGSVSSSFADIRSDMREQECAGKANAVFLWGKVLRDQGVTPKDAWKRIESATKEAMGTDKLEPKLLKEMKKAFELVFSAKNAKRPAEDLANEFFSKCVSVEA